MEVNPALQNDYIKNGCQSWFGVEIKTETKKWEKLVWKNNILRAKMLSFLSTIIYHDTT